MDFFAESGTTAQAVMEQNAVDNGTRRYLLVQLPEPLDPNNNDQKIAADYCDKIGKARTLSELTKEQLRRFGAALRNQYSTSGADLGFRVLKLDSSNIKVWESDHDNLEQSLLDHLEPVKEDRTEDDLLYELLLKRGIDLCASIAKREIAGKQVRAVGDGELLACLSERIAPEDVEELALGIAGWRDALGATDDATVIFRDSAFVDDVAKTNCAEILRQHGVRHVQSV